MKVLVTGAEGFIGSHLVEFLIKKKIEVYGTIWDREHNRENIKHLEDKITLFALDIHDLYRVKEILRKIQPDKIFHLAAQSYPTVSWEEPHRTIVDNMIGTVNIFEALKQLDLNPLVVVASSSAVYGHIENRNMPLKESDELRPLHPYGVSKVGQDLLAYQYYKNFSLKAIRARIFNTTGPRKTHDVASDFSKQVAEIELGKKEPLIKVGNLETYRDITDVRDLVKALWLLSEKGKIGEVYNICSNRTYKIEELLSTLVSLSSKKIKIDQDKDKMRPSDEPVIQGDNSKLIQDTDWKPSYSIEQTLKDMLDYWKEKL
jgi:GDP-4-dehydro-6-deoxy-D-mannose reductase